MQARPRQGGEMSQDSLRPEVHRTGVPARHVDPASHNGKRAYNALSAASVGLEMGLSVVLGLLFGWWLDGQLGTAPWMMLLWLGFGLAAGFRGVLRALRQSDRMAADAVAVARDEVRRG
jgi:ATP synthase protein I